jgi:hypothetical protein
MAEDQSFESLGSMLGDARGEHRLAGAWLADRVIVRPTPALARTDLASRLADLARHDPEERVRTRAVRCTRRLLSQVRAGWADRAVALTDHPEGV